MDPKYHNIISNDKWAILHSFFVLLEFQYTDYIYNTPYFGQAAFQALHSYVCQ